MLEKFFIGAVIFKISFEVFFIIVQLQGLTNILAIFIKWYASLFYIFCLRISLWDLKVVIVQVFLNLISILKSGHILFALLWNSYIFCLILSKELIPFLRLFEKFFKNESLLKSIISSKNSFFCTSTGISSKGLSFSRLFFCKSCHLKFSLSANSSFNLKAR